MRWLVYAFYPRLGIPVRVLNFNSMGELFDYVRGLRLTDTSYAVQDVTDKENPLLVDVEYSDEVGREKMAQMLKALAEPKENER